jgi:hypothetical protein
MVQETQKLTKEERERLRHAEKKKKNKISKKIRKTVETIHH